MRKPNILQRLFDNPVFYSLFLAIFFSVGITVGGQGRLSILTLLINAICGLGFGIVMTIFMRKQTAKFDAAIGISSLQERVSLQHALKTVSVPDDTKVQGLLPVYLNVIEERQAKQRRSNRYILPLLTLVYASNAVIHRSLEWAVFGLVFIGLMLWTLRLTKQRQHNIPILRSRLKHI